VFVVQDYTTHSDRIINKIVSIVMDLTDKCCAGFDVRRGPLLLSWLAQRCSAPTMQLLMPSP
jgi:hypothetical protein